MIYGAFFFMYTTLYFYINYIQFMCFWGSKLNRKLNQYLTFLLVYVITDIELKLRFLLVAF